MSVRDLNDLSAFVAVVASGGFSAAARATGAPKSRISRRVAALEAQLGVQLIERSTRRFKVTDVGEDVYRHARAALSEAEAIDQAVLRLKAEPQGLVRVSCPIDTDRLLGVALPAFLAQHPKLRIQFVVSNRRIDLIDEGVDIAVRVRDRLDTDPDLTLRTIGPAGLMLVASPAQLDGQALEVLHSPLDMGSAGDLFDGNADSLIRGRDANPLVLELRFAQPRDVTALGLHLATMPRFQIKIGLIREDSTTASLTQNYQDLPADPYVELSIPGGPLQVRSVRIEIYDLLPRPDGPHIHVRDIQVR